MDRGAWWATVHGVTESRTQLKELSSTASTEIVMRQNTIKNQDLSLFIQSPGFMKASEPNSLALDLAFSSTVCL